MTTPKITVIVPTRERCDVLEKCLRTLTSQDYDRLQILVSDNNSVDATADVVRAADDGRIRYINTGRRVSMSDNWEFALTHVDDGWVTFLGDDDGLPANAVAKVADIITQSKVMAIRTRAATYEWPEVTGQNFGYLVVPRTAGSRTEIRASATWLPRVLSGKAKYTELPMIYNGGYADMQILGHIKQVTGRYFRSAGPDVYSAIAIARAVDFYAYSDQPLAISGSSKHSTGTSSYSRSKQRNIAPAKTFLGEENIPFHPDMPLLADGSYPLSLHALVYESYLQSDALRRRGDVPPDRLEQLRIIIASSGKHRAQIDEWGRQFAAMHGLDFQRASRDAFAMAFLVRSRVAWNKVANAIAGDCAGTAAQPIRDVYEASIAMAGISDSAEFLGVLRAELRRRMRSC